MRRRPVWIWGGASVVVASAVGFAAVVAVAGERDPVLAVVRDLPAGHVIEAGDLREVRVAADDAVVPAGRAESVVGRMTAVPLVAGSLLAPGQVGPEGSYPPRGRSEVSFAVASGDAPPLERGQRVAVFAGPSAAGLPGAGEEAFAPVVGTVTGVREGDSAGQPFTLTMLIESVGAERAAVVEKPRVVVLSSANGDAR
ncbi:SAF domain-containing protein [Streptomyces radicis]|uniref:SAF domain-containing protein n=1 Tax=Streptomyces radicis TaxID=1750517 RepID=UPI001E5705B2|nr:SAF domain-containing protein [Streptomyces radicis]